MVKILNKGGSLQLKYYHIRAEKESQMHCLVRWELVHGEVFTSFELFVWESVVCILRAFSTFDFADTGRLENSVLLL